MPRFSKFHAQNVDVVRGLDPAVQELFFEFLLQAGNAGIPLRVTAGRRSIAQQNAEYAKGRTVPGSIVTYAQGDESMHVWGLAIDIAPLIQLGPITFQTWYADPAYEQLASVASDLGIDWGKALWGFDEPHFQHTGGLSVTDLRAGTKVPPPVFPVRRNPVLDRVAARYPLHP